jgi:hypothetical protein
LKIVWIDKFDSGETQREVDINPDRTMIRDYCPYILIFTTTPHELRVTVGVKEDVVDPADAYMFSSCSNVSGYPVSGDSC